MKDIIIFLIIMFTSAIANTQTFQKEILESEGLSLEEIQVVDNEDIAILSSSEDGVYLTYLDKDGNLIDHLMICDENPPSASGGNVLHLHKLKKFDNGDLLIVLLTESGMVIMKINSNKNFVFSKRLPIAYEASALPLEDGTFVIVSSTIEDNLIIRKFDIDGSITDQKKIIELDPISPERRLDIAGNNETIFISTNMRPLGNADNNIFVKPHILSFDNALNIINTRELDLTPIAQIEVDADNNLIVRGIPMLLKFDEQLTPIWSTSFINFSNEKDFFYIDNDNNIVGLGIFAANELDFGLSTFKYSNNGYLIYAKRLLDGYPKFFEGIYKSGENILVTSRSIDNKLVVRKLDPQSEASDCGSIEMCYDFISGVPSSIEIELNTIDESADLSEDYFCNPEDLTMELRHVCTPIEKPYASFSVVDDTLCYDEILEVIDSTVYEYGQAYWTLLDSNDLIVYSSTDRVPDNFNDLQRGRYQLVHSVKFAFCEYLDSASIYVNNKPYVELPKDTTVCEESYELFFTGDNYVSYDWNIESDSESIKITESGRYEIVAFNECGIDSDAIDIEFVDCDEGVYMPNIISATSNSQYDFEIYHKGIIALEYIVYDRWGNLIHRAQMPNLNWSISDISRYSKGVYTIFISYTTDDGIKKQMVKNLTII